MPGRATNKKRGCCRRHDTLINAEQASGPKQGKGPVLRNLGRPGSLEEGWQCSALAGQDKSSGNRAAIVVAWLAAESDVFEDPVWLLSTGWASAKKAAVSSWRAIFLELLLFQLRKQRACACENIGACIDGAETWARRGCGGGNENGERVSDQVCGEREGG